MKRKPSRRKPKRLRPRVNPHAEALRLFVDLGGVDLSADYAKPTPRTFRFGDDVDDGGCKNGGDGE